MSTETTFAGPQDPNTGGRTFFGHPRGLSTLFFTEMWERFSYYGMRALLMLFMTAATTNVITRSDGTLIENPGLGLDIATAGAIYGLYTSLVYILALPGGWVADNLWGQRKAVWVGGWIIAAGHFTMAIPTTFSFFLGLVFIICGTGLLKPNVSTVVGELYPDGGARRDAGFSIYYMGINLGALFGPLVTGFLGEGYHWHWGFGVLGKTVFEMQEDGRWAQLPKEFTEPLLLLMGGFGLLELRPGLIFDHNEPNCDTLSKAFRLAKPQLDRAWRACKNGLFIKEEPTP